MALTISVMGIATHTLRMLLAGMENQLLTWTTLAMYLTKVILYVIDLILCYPNIIIANMIYYAFKREI